MKTKALILLAIAIMLPISIMAQDEMNYYPEYKKYFTDESCSELAEPYSTMDDEELLASLGSCPQYLKEIAIKVKNNTWLDYEKEFRVSTYKPYSRAYSWGINLKTTAYSDLNNPTGIWADKGDTLFIFVDNAPEDAETFALAEISGNEHSPAREVKLSKGLNVVTVSTAKAVLFINYKVYTSISADGKKLSDYPDVKIHIEGGKLNGYFDKSRHTNKDWVKMRQTIMKHDIVNVKGEKVLFHMHLKNVAAACPDNIYESINWWDTIVKWQHELMALQPYFDRWNNLMMCRDGGSGGMYATSYYTFYESNTIADILPWEKIKENPTLAWGPAHEIGHMNQRAINIVSCTEVSNNLFANMVIQRLGKTTTRGSKPVQCINDFIKKVPYIERSDVFSKTRMFWQLYLYFHEAKHDTTFYPRLFEYLREDYLSINTNLNAKYSQLLFAEACCKISGMDLSEFFEVWGFFEPMNNVYIQDYDNYHVTLTKETAEESRALMQQYSKKGGHLIFIEDRVKPSKRTDGGSGYRIDYESAVPVGSVGEVGQWEDYMNHDVKAEGYMYAISDGSITIITNENSQGALGFKLYDENGKLVSLSNRYGMNMPAGILGTNFKVVAAQADGTDVEIPSAAEAGNEEQQLEALNSALTAANNILNYTATQSTQVGYYKEEAVATLKEYVEAANKAIENKDQSTLTYGQMATRILNEVYKLSADDNSKIAILPLNYYTMSSRPGNLAYYNNAVKAASNAQVKPASDDRKWEFIQANEEGTFYMKNVGQGTYIANLNENTQVTLTDNIAEASPISIIYNGDGTVRFAQAGNSAIALNAKSDKSIRGYSATDSNSSWKVTLAADNNTAIEDVEAEDAAGENVIYDLTGRKLEEITAPGIYIINGKKRLVK